MATRAYMGAMTLIGAIILPLMLAVLVPTLPSKIENPDTFYWAGREPHTHRPLLLYMMSGVPFVVGGAERSYAISREAPVACYEGPTDSLLTAGQEDGRIEAVTLSAGLFHHLSLSFDLLGNETFIYRCDQKGAHPIFSIYDGFLPGFGFQTLMLIEMIWLMLCWIFSRCIRKPSVHQG